MTDASMQKPLPNAVSKVEDNQTKPLPVAGRPEDVQGARSNQSAATAKVEDGPASRTRLGTGNAGQGYTFEEVNTCPCFHHANFKKLYNYSNYNVLLGIQK